MNPDLVRSERPPGRKQSGRLRLAILCLLGVLAISLAAVVLVRELDPEVLSLRSLEPPVQVIETVLFFDGGSCGLTLEGANGKTLKCGIKSSLLLVGRGNNANPELGRICFYAHHSSQEGAKFLPRGGLAERRLLRILRAWLTREEMSSAESRQEVSTRPVRPELVRGFISRIAKNQ